MRIEPVEHHPVGRQQVAGATGGAEGGHRRQSRAVGGRVPVARPAGADQAARLRARSRRRMNTLTTATHAGSTRIAQSTNDTASSRMAPST